MLSFRKCIPQMSKTMGLRLKAMAGLAAASCSAVVAWEPTFTLDPTFGFNGAPEQVLQDGALKEMSELLAGVWRAPLPWSAVELRPQVYDFSISDDVIAAGKSANLTVFFAFGASNPLYCAGLSPSGDRCISAFVNFTVAAIERYAGRGIFWGLLDEPNVAPSDAFSPHGGWSPAPNVSATAALLLAVGAAARARFPNETIVGPALAPAVDGSGFDVAFMTALFQAGVLPLLHAVDIHPFQGAGEAAGAPEYAINDYFALRNLLSQYALPPVYVPILASAWGYSTATSQGATAANSSGGASVMPQPVVSETAQAKFIGRMTFVDLGCGVNLTSWFAAVDAGSNAISVNDNFGLLRYGYGNASQPFAPKPAFAAAAVVAEVTAGCDFVGLLEISFLPDPLPLPPCFAAYLACPSPSATGSGSSNATEPAYAFWCATSNDTALQAFTFDAVFNTTPPMAHLSSSEQSVSFIAESLLQRQTESLADYAGRPFPLSKTVQQPLRAARDSEAARQSAAGALCLSSFDYLGQPGPAICAGGDPLAFTVQAGNGPTYLRGLAASGSL